MTPIEEMPRGARPFVDFAAVLRRHGFSVSPDQTIGLVAAVGLLGPKSLEDIYRSSHALFGPPPERRDEFDALFRAFFAGQTLAAPAPAEPDDDEIDVADARDGTAEPPEADESREAGAEATALEALTARAFPERDENEALRRFRRLAPERLPCRRTYRRARSKRGDVPDLRRCLREAVRRDGEVLRLPVLARKTRQRRILLLVDVSGSMKEHTDGSLRFAHTLVQTAEQAEVFALGTRLTRMTRPLRIKNRDRALAAASSLVADWDSGTRLGDTLDAFLAVPRFRGMARGAAVIVLSDGLERGEPDVMVNAVRRLSRLAWRLDWLSPLAGSRDFVPQTEALSAILPDLDALGDGSAVSTICDHVLQGLRR